MTAFPLNVRKGRGRGRPRRDGRRTPSGRLQSGPNEMLIERLKEIAPHPSMASNPLDAAFANRWLTEAEHRAGRSYAAIFRRTGLASCLPADHVSNYGEVAERSPEDLRGVSIREMSDIQIDGLWDLVFGEQAPPADDQREKDQIEAMATWRAINAAASPAARAELFAVCVRESWPQWFVSRKAGQTTSRWERNRDSLVEGLEAVAGILKANAPAKRRGPKPRKPRAGAIGHRVLETSEYVDGETGDVVLVVERRGR